MAVRCDSCGGENPQDAAYCLRCGNKLGESGKHPVEPAKEFVAEQAQSTVRKMLETPGTIVLAIGVTLLLISLLLLIFRLWAGLGLLAVSLVLLIVSAVWRGHEAKIAASQASSSPAVVQTEVREREIVKVKCHYCGALNPDGATNCGSCGAKL